MKKKYHHYDDIDDYEDYDDYDDYDDVYGNTYDNVIDLRDHVLSAAAAFSYLREIAYKDLAPHRAKELIAAATSELHAAGV
jgi:hypothetical protein